MMRRVRLVALLLALGFLINLGVGYACWARVCLFDVNSTFNQRTWTDVIVLWSPSSCYIEWQGIAIGFYGTRTEERHDSPLGYDIPDEIEKRMHGRGTGPRSCRIEFHTSLHERFGFPMQSLGRETRGVTMTVFDEQGKTTQRYTDETSTPRWFFGGVENGLVGNHSPFSTIPVNIWGMETLVNTVFYTSLSVLGFRLFVRARGAWRRGRGHCSGCGYAVGELAVCPECGAARSSGGVAAGGESGVVDGA